MFTTSFKIKPIPPFNFDLTARLFSDGDKQIRIYNDEYFQQVLRINEKLFLVNIQSEGTLTKPELIIQLCSQKEISKLDQQKAVDAVTDFFNLNFNLNHFYDNTKKDLVMDRICQKLVGLQSPITPTVYEALIDSIVEQQISIKVANNLEKKIVKFFGETLELNGQIYYKYPEPNALAFATIEDLRKCGLSQRKAEYIKELSHLIYMGKINLEGFKNYSNPHEIIKELDLLKGVGVWTAELTIIRSMKKWDVFPADDLGLKRVVAYYYNKDKNITSHEVRKIAAPWGNYKGIAVHYLMMAESLGLNIF